jgi:invasion protein IalB
MHNKRYITSGMAVMGIAGAAVAGCAGSASQSSSSSGSSSAEHAGGGQGAGSSSGGWTVSCQVEIQGRIGDTSGFFPDTQANLNAIFNGEQETDQGFVMVLTMNNNTGGIATVPVFAVTTSDANNGEPVIANNGSSGPRCIGSAAPAFRASMAVSSTLAPSRVT